MRATATPKSAAFAALAIAGTVLLAQACDYPTFEFRSKGQVTTSTAGSGGTGTAFPTGGTAATGGTGAGTTTTTTGVAGSGNTGAGATGGAPPCDPLDVEACTSGMKCTWLPSSSEFGCAPAGPTAEWYRCNGDTDCIAGTWCDAVSGVCKPFCGGAGDCPAGVSCIDALDQPGGNSLGFRICMAHCDPRNGDPCGPNTNCVYVFEQTEFDCVPSLNLAVGSPCEDHSDCIKGSACPAGDDVCLEWCTCNTGAPNGCYVPYVDYCDWSNFWVCVPTNPETTYGDEVLGICGP